ncbi:hypothetical protein NQD34_007589, partial [Periophthalmus magnuspinnatus]
NTEALSFTSKTLIIMTVVPDFGVPPSTAVKVSLITDCFSRSKVFCRISSVVTSSLVRC